MAVVVSAAAARELAGEARRLSQVLRNELSPKDRAGPVVVSGVLAEQLAKELAAGADPGAVRLGDDVPDAEAEVLVRVVAGEPTGADERFVAGADRHGVPVVLLQLWPQADWKRPFVLSPFVVECRAGEGFPLPDIGAAIVEAAERSAQLAATVPAIRVPFERKVVMQSVARAALLGVLSGDRPARPLITLEQVRLATRLNALDGVNAEPSRETPVVASIAGGAIAVGFAFRGVARAARLVLPDSMANGLVAAAGTFALATAVRAFARRERA